jgi:DNA-binding CsgD family transcriptional regulator
VEAFAPMVVHAVRLHHAGQTLDHGLSDLLLERLGGRFPQLTKRDLDVVRSLLAGHATETLADHMGLTVASAQTYQKRVYRKLGVSGQRELLAMLVEPVA